MSAANGRNLDALVVWSRIPRHRQPQCMAVSMQPQGSPWQEIHEWREPEGYRCHRDAAWRNADGLCLCGNHKAQVQRGRAGAMQFITHNAHPHGRAPARTVQGEVGTEVDHE